MKSRAGSTSVWLVILLACVLWLAFSFHDQAASAWHKAAIAAHPADKLGAREGCPVLLNSTDPDDIQYCVKRGIASAHAEGWTALSYLAALVLGIPVIVLGIFVAARWVATVVRRIPPRDTAHNRRA
ncbi:MAG TPA: hypothetical protein VM659_17735 [Dongiaceae bacterium]|nr:hypothetical protein [Dongiaceae bacterium]